MEIYAGKSVITGLILCCVAFGARPAMMLRQAMLLKQGPLSSDDEKMATQQRNAFLVLGILFILYGIYGIIRG